MGAANGFAGEPWLGAGVYNPNASPDRDSSENPFDPPRSLIRSVGTGAPTRTWSDDQIIEVEAFPGMRARLEDAHNDVHSYIGGTIGNPHTSFRDPFVFLLHSNVDRLFALWQLQRGKEWRLDPEQVYGAESNTDIVPGASIYDPGILTPLDPWAGNPNIHPEVHRIRPWTTPENEDLEPENRKNSKHASVVVPPAYDTNPVKIRVTGVQEVAVAPLSNAVLQLWAADAHANLWSTWKTSAAPDAHWEGWADFLAEVGSLPAAAQQVAVAPLSNAALQLWVTDANGGLMTTWKTSADPNAGWAAWADFLAEVGSLPAAVRQVAVAPLPDKRLHLWVTDANGGLWTTWKINANPDANWVPWVDFSEL
jgi:hypothetical protein